MSARRPIPALAPLSPLYLAAARLHHALYDRGLRRTERVEAPVVAIGNLTVGGTGKTPTTIWLAAKLSSLGHEVGIVSRGYGAPERRTRDEPLVVARDGRLCASPAAAGDEPILIATRAPVRTVVVGADRASAARRAIELGAEVLLLDDGFQHRRLHRDVDVLLLDATRPFGNGLGLPAGPLREPPAAVGRADLVVLTRAGEELLAREGPLTEDSIPADLARHVRGPVIASSTRPTALRSPEGLLLPLDRLEGRRVLAVSGIARPDSFESTILALGGILTDHLAFGDHHTFDEEDLRTIASRSDSCGAEMLLTTAKDAVRWPPGAPPPHVLEIEVVVPAAETLLEVVLGAVDGSEHG